MLGLFMDAKVRDIGDQDAVPRGGCDVDPVGSRPEPSDDAAVRKLVDQLAGQFGGDDEQRIAIARSGQYFVTAVTFQGHERCPGALQLTTFVVLDGVGPGTWVLGGYPLEILGVPEGRMELTVNPREIEVPLTVTIGLREK